MPLEEFPHRRSHNRDGAFFAQSFNHLIERRVRRLCKHTENEIKGILADSLLGGGALAVSLSVGCSSGFDRGS